MSWRSRKKERGHFLYCLFCPKEIFLVFVFYLTYSVLNTRSEYTYFYVLTIIALYTFFCLFLKLSKAFSVSLIIAYSLRQKVDNNNKTRETEKGRQQTTHHMGVTKTKFDKVLIFTCSFQGTCSLTLEAFSTFCPFC